MAQACPPPTDTDAHGPTLVTCTGVVLPVSVPMPSCPSLFAPQQYRLPSVVSPQVVVPPALTADQSVPEPTRVGVVRSTVSPNPSCPWPLRPQHHRVESVPISQV